MNKPTVYASNDSIDGNEALCAARARLVRAAQRSKHRRTISNDTGYYGTKVAQLEETIGDVAYSLPGDAVVTRNHYGSLVLNAARTLFIDVDFTPPGGPHRWLQALAGSRRRAWHKMVDDLRLVLQRTTDEAFRIYRTAGGFRLLVTTREFEPRSQPAHNLMEIVGADDAFMKLCRIQNSFRARLTPKPWRCGAKRPPGAFPRETAEEQRKFGVWLARYESAC